MPTRKSQTIDDIRDLETRIRLAADERIVFFGLSPAEAKHERTEARRLAAAVAAQLRDEHRARGGRS